MSIPEIIENTSESILEINGLDLRTYPLDELFVDSTTDLSKYQGVVKLNKTLFKKVIDEFTDNPSDIDILENITSSIISSTYISQNYLNQDEYGKLIFLVILIL